MTHFDTDALIIGGGISGLATAWWLAQSGLNIEVWEKSHRPGGKINTTDMDGYQTEQAASMVMNFKPEVEQFLTQSGLQEKKSNRLLHSKSKRYLIHKGHLQSLPMTIPSLFFSPLWSSRGKLRLLMEPFIAKGSRDNETVSEFIIRRFGSEFLEKAMEPFISGTLASNPDLACAQQVLPRLTALEKRYGSITAGMMIHKLIRKRTARNTDSFSFKGGMSTLTEHLANIPQLGFKAEHQVKHIIQHAKYHWEIQASSPGGEVSYTTRHVILSNPSYAAAKLLQPVSYRLSQLLESIEYAPLSVVHIGLQRSAVKHPLDSIGFLVPRQEQMNINGNLWMSSIFPERAPEGQVLLSSYLGGSRHLSANKLSAQQSIDRVLADIKPLLGITASPMMGRVDKHQQALPLYHGQYQQKLASIENELQSLSGLHLQANYKDGVSVRDRIAAAQQAAVRIISQLSSNHKFKQTPSFNHPILTTHP